MNNEMWITLLFAIVVMLGMLRVAMMEGDDD